MIKKALVLAGAALVLPFAAHAQINAQEGIYIGAGGGIVFPFNATTSIGTQTNPGVGWNVGGALGYDFVGPRVQLEVGYTQVSVPTNIAGTAINGKAGQLNVMGGLYYDFM